jgi:hypothetical protein
MTAIQFGFLLFFIFLNNLLNVYLCRKPLLFSYKATPEEILTDRMRMGDITAIALKLKKTMARTKPTLKDYINVTKMKISDFIRVKKRKLKKFVTLKTKKW